MSREVQAAGGRQHYPALQAERSARHRARRPQVAKLARCHRLRRIAEAGLENYWSPQEISAWLALEYPDDPEMQVSNGTIYMSLFVHIRGAVPGHWEGDLIYGRRMTTIGTLVDRSTRYVMLFALPHGHTAEAVNSAMAKKIRALPTELRRSLTWDQGKEMAEHARFTIDTGLPVYFYDPNSPWQRGSNENTNGLLR